MVSLLFYYASALAISVCTEAIACGFVLILKQGKSQQNSHPVILRVPRRVSK